MQSDAMLYWGLGLVALSLLLLVIEVFVPSGGIIAAVSGLAAIAGLVLLFRHDTTWGLTGTLVLAIVAPAAVMFSLKVLPSTPVGRALMGLEHEADIERRELAERELISRRRALVDTQGVAVTDLHPIGEIEIDGESFQALAENEWIHAGEAVVVTDAGGLDLRVRRA